jgi:hypothetical protein
MKLNPGTPLSAAALCILPLATNPATAGLAVIVVNRYVYYRYDYSRKLFICLVQFETKEYLIYTMS